MTKRPNALHRTALHRTAPRRSSLGSIALALCVTLGLSACAEKKDEGAGHAQVHYQHISAKSGDAARGEKLAADKKVANGQSCIDCHGAQGAKPIDPTYPVLAGQYADYLFHTLQAYRDGGREHALMSGHVRAGVEAGTLNDQAFADLAAYFAAQPSPLDDLDHRN
jgi:cytochrome c553